MTASIAVAITPLPSDFELRRDAVDLARLVLEVLFDADGLFDFDVVFLEDVVLLLPWAALPFDLAEADRDPPDLAVELFDVFAVDDFDPAVLDPPDFDREDFEAPDFDSDDFDEPDFEREDFLVAGILFLPYSNKFLTYDRGANNIPLDPGRIW